MFDTVIFDMDGTILNTLTDLHISTNFALEKLGFPKRRFDEIKNFVGNGVEMLIRRALPENVEDSVLKDCMSKFKKHYSENMYNNTKPYDGIIEVLKFLKYPSPATSVWQERSCCLSEANYNSGEVTDIKTAILSNKFDSAVKELSKKYFDGLIDFSLGQSDDVPPKPNPTGVLRCINELQAKNPILVGDSDVDIQTAKNAGILSVGVTWGFRDRSYLKGADYIIDEPKELLEIINK